MRRTGFCRNLIREEGGQATTEYILLLATMVALAVYALNTVLKPLFGRLQGTVSQEFQRLLFGGDLHSFPVRGRR